MAILAASMKPGTWAQLQTNNFKDGNELRSRLGGSALEYTDKAGAWNPVTKSVVLLGSSHPSRDSPCPNSRDVFAIYTSSTNTWANNYDSNLRDPCPDFDDAFAKNGGIGHAYRHNTIDPNTGFFYHREFGTGKVMVYKQSANAWSLGSVINPGSKNFQVAGRLAYFPDRNSLVFVDGDWGVWKLSLASGDCYGTWVERASTFGSGKRPQLTGFQGYNQYNQFNEYSPMCHCLMLGAGNGAGRFWKMSSSGNFTEMSASPFILSTPQSTNGAVITTDPVTGLFLVWDGNNNAGGVAWQYDPSTDIWTKTGINSPIFPIGGGGSSEGDVTQTIAVPIPDYGVVMFIQAGRASGGTIYLYKHTGGAPADSRTKETPSSLLPATSETRSATQHKQSMDDKRGGTGEQTRTVSNSISETAVGTNFHARCNSPGVIRCVGFDSPSEIAGGYGGDSGIFSGATTPTIDSAIKASGNGSLKFTIPSKSGADTSGTYFANFSKDLSVQFGENSDFYVQWRQRFSPEFLSTVYRNGGGWKQAIIGSGDQPGHPYASCSTLEVVVQNTYQRGFAQMYNSCTGSSSHGPYDPFQERFGAYDFKLQNARMGSSCLYSQGQANPSTFFPPKGNCFGYFANEWMTFQILIKTGPRVRDEFSKSYVRLWIAREGQPSQLVINWGPYNLSAGNPNEDQKYGKIWLLPYHTNKDSSQLTPVAYVWYDELIISRSRIPDPK